MHSFFSLPLSTLVNLFWGAEPFHNSEAPFHSKIHHNFENRKIVHEIIWCLYGKTLELMSNNFYNKKYLKKISKNLLDQRFFLFKFEGYTLVRKYMYVITFLNFHNKILFLNKASQRPLENITEIGKIITHERHLWELVGIYCVGFFFIQKLVTFIVTGKCGHLLH